MGSGYYTGQCKYGVFLPLDNGGLKSLTDWFQLKTKY